LKKNPTARREAVGKSKHTMRKLSKDNNIKRVVASNIYGTADFTGLAA
jgi:hypothetical protein